MFLVTQLETPNQLTRNPFKAPMIKTSTSKKITENQSAKSEKTVSPSNETINALLNFSKSLSVSKSNIMKQMIVVTN